MLKGDAGKNFPHSRGGRYDERGDATRDAIRILVVDPVLGSRFSLVQATSQPGYIVDATASIEDARSHLERPGYGLIIADHAVGGGLGLEFLSEVRKAHPDVHRALVTQEAGLGFKRAAIGEAALSFLLTKPWSPEALRRTIRELLGEASDLAGWDRLSAPHEPTLPRADLRTPSLQTARRHEVLLRGLLAGLNSCETPREAFELVHAELVEAFQIASWLWVDEETGLATRVAGDWPVEEGIALDALSDDEKRYLDQARRSARVTRIDVEHAHSDDSCDQSACLSFTLRMGGSRTNTCLIWLDHTLAPALVSLLRELQVGLQMAFQRIREAEARSAAARRLARRVSEELRTPVGALTHAIDRLRGEAERAGLSTEWVDRISSESERVVRVVEHLEGEMLAQPSRSTSTVG